MFLEFAIIGCVLFFIFVWFYKQRRAELELLQVEFANSATALRDLSQEKQPIIIRGVPVPTILTAARLAQIPRLAEFPLNPEAAGTTLGAYRATPGKILPDWQLLGRPILTDEAGTVAAQELSIPLWVTRTLQEPLLDLGSLPFLTSFDSRILLGGAGMTRTVPSYLCILPTDGTYILSLVSPSSETFLPTAWEHRYPQSLTINDTPMVGEIKYIDVILRPGTMVCIPSQTIYSLQPKDYTAFNAATVIEVHSPISKLAKMLGGAGKFEVIE